MATRTQRAQKPKSSKSSLVSHTFPPFYACYLLKSIRNPKSTSTYIGSTPHPPRRIRQHNGEITQGAWKTAWNRPWVMSMIVHGFPSKLAALQFEWAWQHPDVSRHLKQGDISKARSLKANIAVARMMLTSHPYTSWPLHVKLFTPEAVKAWTEACKNPTPLPPGFTCSVELEGVDGKQNDVGSGRTGPIDVTDKTFTSEHLAKHIAVLSTGEQQQCTICGSGLDFHNADALSLALCPTSDCIAYSHLSCLADAFLAESLWPSVPSLIPRGGACRSCHNYVLWGDIIRGGFRRRTGDHGTMVEQSTIVEEAERESDHDRGTMFEDGSDKSPRTPVRHRKLHTAQKETKGTPRKQTKKKLQVVPLQEEAEFFDLDAVSGSDSSFSQHRPHGEKKVEMAPRPRGRPPGSKSKSKPMLALDASVSREFFDIDEFSSATDDVADHDSPPSRRRKKQPTSGPGRIPADPLVSMPMNVDISETAPGRSVHTEQTLKRSQKRSSRDRTDSGVIEISDDD